jgi:hypothetical protein
MFKQRIRKKVGSLNLGVRCGCVLVTQCVGETVARQKKKKNTHTQKEERKEVIQKGSSSLR